MAFIKIDKTGRIKSVGAEGFHCGEGEIEVSLPAGVPLEKLHEYILQDGQFVHSPQPANSFARILELQQLLRDTVDDVLRIVEGEATLAECADIIKQRAAWRAELKKLRAEKAGSTPAVVEEE